MAQRNLPTTPTTHQVSIELPEGFYLRFDYDRNCPSILVGKHSRRFKSARKESPIYFNVDQLAASAVLRHYGTGYKNPLLAIAKEKVLWAGWMDVTKDGSLLVRENETGHSGRLVEFSASIGEAVALALLEKLFTHPLSLYRRIPEHGTEGMDFAVNTKLGTLAVEAKGRGDTRLSSAKKEISKQMARQAAAEKYGIVVMYQKRQTKKSRSRVHVVDPPGMIAPAADPSHGPALLVHYYQLAWTIGIWRVADLLGERLGLARPEIAPDISLRLVADLAKMRLPKVSIHGRTFYGRFFDPSLLERDGTAEGNEVAKLPYFYYGIDRTVLELLVAGGDADLRKLLEYTSSGRLALGIVRQGKLGMLRYAGLSDGVLRIDLSSAAQLTKEDLDIE